MMKRLVCLLALALHTLVSSAQTPEYTDAFRLLDQWFEAQVDYDNLPGISVGIVKDQQLIYSRGFGKADIEKKIPADANTLYSICSISKLFTSVAILQLRDAGKLRLDDEVSTVLPWFKMKQTYADSGPITIRTLLTHSSGLPREADFPYWTEATFPTKDQIIDKVNQQQTLYPANTYFQYSNLGMSLLGYIVEAVSGKPYDTYIDENILTPLRLANTRTHFRPDLWRGKLATGYSDASRKGERKMMDKFDTKGISPAAGYTSSVGDLALFASWQLRLLQKGGTEILKSSTLKEMHNVQYMDPNWRTSWGLGFTISQVDGKTYVSHGGYCPGYQTLLMINPKDKLAFIIMINAIGTDPNKYFEGMRTVLAKAGDEKSGDHKNVTLEPYCGLYGMQPWGGEMIVSSWGDKLALLYLPNDNPKNMILLKHIHDDTFRRIRDDGELGEDVTFERDKAGKVIKLWRHSNYRKKLR